MCRGNYVLGYRLLLFGGGGVVVFSVFLRHLLSPPIDDKIMNKITSDN